MMCCLYQTNMFSYIWRKQCLLIFRVCLCVCVYVYVCVCVCVYVYICVCIYIYLVQVNEDGCDGVQEAGQLVEALLLTVGLRQVHLLAALDQLRVHQVHVLGTHLFAWLWREGERDNFDSNFHTIYQKGGLLFKRPPH